MKKTVLTIILTVLIVIAVGAVVMGVVAQSGMINVAATADFLPGVRWFFGTLTESSIRVHAKTALDEGRITPPEQISQTMLDTGRHHYVEMCVECHGAPGVDRGEIGKGLKPHPPDLSHSAEEFSIAEIYWVVENGIRHTGMPAYGETHSPDKLWAIAAFVEELETMTPEEYARLTSASATEESESREGSESGEEGHTGHTH